MAPPFTRLSVTHCVDSIGSCTNLSSAPRPDIANVPSPRNDSFGMNSDYRLGLCDDLSPATDLNATRIPRRKHIIDHQGRYTGVCGVSIFFRVFQWVAPEITGVKP